MKHESNYTAVIPAKLVLVKAGAGILKFEHNFVRYKYTLSYFLGCYYLHIPNYVYHRLLRP
jgi:hypothetical protein